eukprot:365775-Chlamydomonas_euryale.AAC.4
MRGSECSPSCKPEAGWSVHKTFVEAAGRGLSRLPRVGRPSALDMHALGLRPRASASGLETVGRDTHVLCKDDPAKVSHEGKREERTLMHTA